MQTAYISLTQFWTTDIRRLKAELQLDVPEDPAEQHLTTLQAFGFNTGEPVSGQAVMDVEALRLLHEVTGHRLAELATRTAELVQAVDLPASETGTHR